MLKNIYKNCLRNIALSCLFAFTLSTHAAPKKAEPIDLSIVQQRDQLAVHMDQSQRISLLQLEGKIEQAQSDISSAQFMIDTKPSAFNPKEEVAKVNQRGKKLLGEAEARLRNAQSELVSLLSTVKAEREVVLAKEAVKFDFTLETDTYENAFTESAKALLSTARTKGYKTVFFDEIFQTNQDGTHASTPSARNKVYDKLIDIDGTHFALSVPQGLKLDEEADSAQLTFDNLEGFKDDKLALLAIELIETSAGVNYLYFRLLDLRTHQIIAHHLTIVTEPDALLEAETTEVVAETEEGSEEVTAEAASTTETAEEKVADAPVSLEPILSGVTIRDQNMWLDKLAQQTYNFEVIAETPMPLITSALLIHTILENTTMKMVDSDFILRAYGSPDSPEAKQAGALLKIIDEGDSLTLSARSYGNDRTIEIGTMALTYE